MACSRGTVMNPFTAVSPPPSATSGTRSSGALVAHRHAAIQELCVVLQVIDLAEVVVELLCRSLLSLRFSGSHWVCHCTACQADAVHGYGWSSRCSRCHAAGIAVDVSSVDVGRPRSRWAHCMLRGAAGCRRSQGRRCLIVDRLSSIV
eukprot:10937371-Heterocapsa_arctica.AAC.1